VTIYRERRADPFEHLFRDIDLEEIWDSAMLSCPSRHALLEWKRKSSDPELRRRFLGYLRYHVEVRRCLHCRAELTKLSLHEGTSSGMN